MSTRERLQTVRIRIMLLMGVMFIFSGFLMAQLWRIQVIRGEEFASSLDHQSIRRVRLPGVRGRIHDRNGEILADNQPSYCIAIYTEELRQRGPWGRTIDHVDGVIDELADVLALDRQVSRSDIERHVQRRLPLPFLAWRGLDAAAMARWAESGRSFPGVDIYVESKRVYPHGKLASHLLGYVGRADTTREEDENPYHYYLPEMAGRAGIERSADRHLRGRAGGRLIRVDATGFKYEEYGELEPVAGQDVYLTLDLKIQQYAENVLSNQPGAVVVMDPENGDVLALASGPEFDRDVLASRTLWQETLEDPDRPAMNRAIAGQYPPGSTFKPLVALAGMLHGRIDANTTISCPGYYRIGNVRMRCWLRRGHGNLQLADAITQSCNPYFIETAMRTGHTRVHHMADSVGFGRRTGIALPGESAGILPDDTWKRRNWDDAWRPGDTANVSIGQGALLATPLQMAVFTAALANGGRVYRPRLFAAEEYPPVLEQQMAWAEEHLEVVQEGMLGTIHGDRGTGRRAYIPGVEMAGKTGTAQFGRDRTHAWMLLYAPYDAPRYAVVMILEDESSGGIIVGPRLQELMRAILERDGLILPLVSERDRLPGDASQDRGEVG